MELPTPQYLHFPESAYPVPSFSSIDIFQYRHFPVPAFSSTSKFQYCLFQYRYLQYHHFQEHQKTYFLRCPENCQYWKMLVLKLLVLENASTEHDSNGKCRCWKCQYLKMPILEIASTRKYRYWKMTVVEMPVLENACTGKRKYCSVEVLYIFSEMESRTQGLKPRPRTQKNPRPRPRTALLRTDPLEAKDRKARGQGHRRKCSPRKRSSKFFFRHSPKKKSSKKSFQAISKREKQKRSSQIFREVSFVFLHKFKNEPIPTIIGTNANAHHIIWGSSNTNPRVEDLLAYCVSVDLNFCNVGNKPT